MRPNRIRTPFAALLAAALVLITLTACHDDIPDERDDAVPLAVVEVDPDSGQAAPQVRYLRPKESLSYGVTEQGNYPRFTSVSYRVASEGAAWDGVSLTIICIGDSRSLRIGSLPWQEQNRGTLLLTLDDQPPLAEDVYLTRSDIHHFGGRIEKTSTADLSDAVWYERLRSAKTLTIGLLDSDLVPPTFDLTRLFSTPFQDEVDNCTNTTTRSWARQN